MSTAVDIRPGPGDHDVQLLVRVDLIRPAADNLRRQLGDLASLTASIAASGVQQPLRLVPVDPMILGILAPGEELGEYDRCEYEVVDGHRRLAAAVDAGLGWVPAIVRRMSDAERVETMLTTALLREDLLPTEEAEGYRRLVETGLSQREIAKRFGVDQSHISKTVKLCGLPERARAWVDAGPDSGGITREMGRLLAGLPADVQAELVAHERPHPNEIEHQARREALRQKRVAAEKAAADTGCTVVDSADVSYNPNGGAMWLSYLRGEDRPGCAEDFHMGEPCHAVAWQGSEMAAVCIDPARHPLHAPGRAAEIKAARDAENERRSQEQVKQERCRVQAAEIRCRRLAFHRHLVGLVGVNKIIGLAAVMLPMGSDDTDLGGVARALGIPLFDVKVEQVPVGDDAEGWYAECVCGSAEESDTKAEIEAWKSAHLAGHDTDDHSDDPDWDEILPMLHEFAARDIRNEAQVVYALALTVGEGFAEPRERGWQGPEGDFEKGMRSRYFDFLTAEGYELSDLERSWLPQPEPAGVASDGEAVRPDSAVESEAEPPATPERRRCEQCGGIPASRISPLCAACEKAQAERQAAASDVLAREVCEMLRTFGWATGPIPWPSIERPMNEWAQQEPDAGTAQAVCRALAGHVVHGGGIPWPAVRTAFDAWRYLLDRGLDDGLPDEPEFDVDGDGQGVYTEPVDADLALDAAAEIEFDGQQSEGAPAEVEEFEGQVIARVLPGNIERYDWECTCGSAGGRLIEDPDEAAEDLDAHMLDAHGYSPVEAV